MIKSKLKNSIKNNFRDDSLSVLFVDDEEKSAKYFKKIFANYFNTITAINAKEAWNIISKYSDKIAVIVSDQKMPDETGVELLKKVKNKYPNIVRILSTAYASLSDNVAAINQSSIFAYVNKPWNILEVKEIILRAFDEFNSKIALQNLGGSIAHEIRNPLGAINLSLHQIKDYIKNTQKNCKLDCAESQVEEMISVAFKSTKRANELIDMTLNNIQGRKINKNAFGYLVSTDVIKQSIAEYGYQDNEERRIIKENYRNVFPLKGDETLLMYVIFNIIKNALHYKCSKPNFKISISCCVNNGQNAIKIKDNGPGIPENNIESIFENFITSGKKGGTGLGLPFCRRVMHEFGGNINCKSVLGEYAEFILTFPVLNQEQILEAKKELSIKRNTELSKFIKILLIKPKNYPDNTETLIKKTFRNASIHVANKNLEIENYLLNKHNHNCIILIQYEENHFDIIKEIKKSNTNSPIILLNKPNSGTIEFDDYINNSNNYNEKIIRNICKWNFIKYVPKLPGKGITLSLKNKKILLADDEEVNRMIFAKILRSHEAIVNEAKNGAELYQEYMRDKYDLVISDINMPILDGQKAIAKIRKYEENNNIKHIPIIFYSGNSTNEILSKDTNIGINDHFAKGDRSSYLLDLTWFWINIESSKDPEDCKYVF